MMDEDEEFEEYYDSDARWGEHLPASEEEARAEWEAEIDRTWELWYRQVAVNYPECEKAEGYR